MRSRFDFYFDGIGLRFDGPQRYDADITKEHAAAAGLPPQAFKAKIDIEPDGESRNPLVQQTGKLKITLPGRREMTEDLAFWLAEQTAQQITFSHGRIKINYGLIMGEHLPDNAEEAEQLGDKPFFAEVHLVEHPPSPVFNGPPTIRLSGSHLIQQFNDADRAENTVDRYLGFFRILEDLFGPTSKTSLAESLKASDELFHIANQLVRVGNGERQEEIIRTAEDFPELVDQLVKTRHECAHLRSAKQFGIAHGDPRVSSQVEPLTKILRALALGAIKRRS